MLINLYFIKFCMVFAAITMVVVGHHFYKEEKYNEDKVEAFLVISCFSSVAGFVIFVLLLLLYMFIKALMY